MFNIPSAYPKGWSNPTVARVSAALPAAGAWDATPLELVTAYAENAHVFVTYTRGAAGGAVDYAVQVSPYSGTAIIPTGAEEWVEQSALAIGGVAAGADTQSREQMEYTTFEPVGALVETTQLGPFQLGGTIERMRILARESGVVGTPGTCQITLELL